MKIPTLEMFVVAWPTAAPQQRLASYIALQSDAPPATACTTSEVLPRREAAKRFHRHPSFVDRLVRAGLIAPVRLNGRKRACGFRSSDIEKLMGVPE